MTTAIYRYHRPTLFDIIYYGNCRDVETALKKKDVNVLDFNSEGQTILHLASGDNRVPFDVFKLVIKKRIAAINFQNLSAGNTPLHCACLAKNLEKMRYLVKKRAELEARNNCFETPLLVACKQQASEIVTYLLAKGANRDAEDDDQKTVATISHNFPNNTNLKTATETSQKLNFGGKLKKILTSDVKLEKENWSLRRLLHEADRRYIDFALHIGSMPNPLRREQPKTHGHVFHAESQLVKFNPIHNLSHFRR